MPSQKLDPSACVALAAQADLVLITVEMLRSPQSVDASSLEPWYELPLNSLLDLLDTALDDMQLGDTATTINADEVTPTLPEALQEVYRLAVELNPDTWSDEYWRLFDSSQACTLNQASYIRRDKGTILGDVCGFYNAFGWKGNVSRGERPDNLLCQLEFVGMMLAMAARATNEDQRRIVQDALAEFARLHMHDWLPAVCYHLIDSTRLAYFGAVGQWILLLWSRLTEFHSWPIDPASNSPLAPSIDPEDPYECGAPDLVQLQTKDIGSRS